MTEKDVMTRGKVTAGTTAEEEMIVIAVTVIVIETTTDGIVAEAALETAAIVVAAAGHAVGHRADSVQEGRPVEIGVEIGNARNVATIISPEGTIASNVVNRSHAKAVSLVGCETLARKLRMYVGKKGPHDRIPVDFRDSY